MIHPEAKTNAQYGPLGIRRNPVQLLGTRRIELRCIGLRGTSVTARADRLYCQPGRSHLKSLLALHHYSGSRYRCRPACRSCWFQTCVGKVWEALALDHAPCPANELDSSDNCYYNPSTRTPPNSQCCYYDRGHLFIPTRRPRPICFALSDITPVHLPYMMEYVRV